ncbi:rho GTPase-activating protein 39-like protein [Leptotrombidium deliense]|uniref:Rho GTPase-activating protein 39-like protein n=1 Tax=Leptotrombidium deliense TaxID=299467 RepID=A0A443SKH4_9ACAR|nr:rho GTPase-activating protein 39-like protein [Leptotrombidium deliense]
MDSEWIRVKEPLRKEEKMFINLKTGECLWEPPFNVKRIRESQEQWWELFDERTNRFYYYNSTTMETKWEKPKGSESSLIIIPLHKLKIMKNQTKPQTKEDKQIQTIETLKVLIDNETQTEEQYLWQHHHPYSIYATTNDEGKNSLKDYLISEARFAELYAKENIKRHIKKGGVNLLLKRKESMKGMLIWTKNSIKQPMIATLLSLGNEMKQDAIQCFKLIQEYCGDRENLEKKDSLLIIHELITKCVMKGVCLRDEIFVQLCRQTTSNPSDESCRKGLQLIAICLFYFGPSSKFAPYLTSFLMKHKLNDDQVIKVAQNKLEKRINLMKNGSTNYGGKHGEHLIEMSGFTKKPSSNLKELQMIIDAIESGEFGWFGESLQSTVSKQLDKQRKLPWIQVELSEIILKLNGLQSEGIFRIGPDFEEMSSIRLQIDCKQMNSIQFDVNDDVNIYASLLKQWFRELYSPLIPYELYEHCLRHCESPEQATNIVLNQLPLINKLSLGYLIRFLQVFAAQKNVLKTKMDENNLSMVWSPNILRSPIMTTSATASSITTSTSLFENTRKEMLFIKTLIKHLNTSFIQGII